MEQRELIDPPESYDFRNLIEDFCDAMDENDVRKVKRRFGDILPEDVQTSEQLVDSLVENKYISADNIVYLQQIVRVLIKKDLLKRTIEYAERQRQKVLHFIVSSPEIRDGFPHIQIHVRGYRCQTEEDVQTIRQQISNIVLVPLEDISVIRKETTNSLLITFMLPKLYVEVMKEYLVTKKFHIFQPLIRLGIDEIRVSGVSYNIKIGQAPSLIASNSDRGGAFSGLPIAAWYRKIKTLVTVIATYLFNI